jgi:hypothetical protein
MGDKKTQDEAGPVEGAPTEETEDQATIDKAAGGRQKGETAWKVEGMPGSGVIVRVATILLSIRERVRDAIADGREGATESEAEARQRYEVMTRRRRPKKSA